MLARAGHSGDHDDANDAVDVSGDDVYAPRRAPCAEPVGPPLRHSDQTSYSRARLRGQTSHTRYYRSRPQVDVTYRKITIWRVDSTARMNGFWYAELRRSLSVTPLSR